MQTSLTQNYSYISDKIVRALNYGARAHRKQLRKDIEETPYFAHPAGVGLILAQTGCPEHVVIAGILHDVIEDTDVTYEQLADEFGTEVADLVQWVSIPAGLSGREGKVAYLDNLDNAPYDAKLISASDMLYNRIDLIISLEKGGEALTRFQTNPYLAADLNDRRIKIIERSLGPEHNLVKDLKEQNKILAKFINE